MAFLVGELKFCGQVLKALYKGDMELRGSSSLWMFPIYGMGVFLEPIIDLLKLTPWSLRGVTYMLCIFIAEYVCGTILNKFNVCPWDYSSFEYSIDGVIRLDYAPCWFLVGLLYEYIYVTF